MNTVAQRVDDLRIKRGWSIYKLSQESGVPAPTISKWFQTKLYPSIPILMQICNGFGITMANFFADDDLVQISPEHRKLIDDFSALNKGEQEAVKAFIKSYLDNKQ